MNKVQKALQNYKQAVDKVEELEYSYIGKKKGDVYNMRMLTLQKKMKYYEKAIKELGKEKIALVKLTYYDRNNILVTKKMRLVGLNEEEIELLCKTRIPQGYLTKQVKFLASGFTA